MKPKKLIIKTHTEQYPILIGSNLIEKFALIIKKNSNALKCKCVLDENHIYINICIIYRMNIYKMLN